jgi:8-oxoguanine deaminase
MVKGVWKVEDGMPVDVDVQKLRAEHGAAAKAFLAAL